MSEHDSPGLWEEFKAQTTDPSRHQFRINVDEHNVWLSHTQYREHGYVHMAMVRHYGTVTQALVAIGEQTNEDCIFNFDIKVREF